MELIDPNQGIWVYQHQQKNLSSTEKTNFIPKAVSKKVGADSIQNSCLLGTQLMILHVWSESRVADSPSYYFSSLDVSLTKKVKT